MNRFAYVSGRPRGKIKYPIGIGDLVMLNANGERWSGCPSVVFKQAGKVMDVTWLDDGDHGNAAVEYFNIDWGHGLTAHVLPGQVVAVN